MVEILSASEAPAIERVAAAALQGAKAGLAEIGLHDALVVVNVAWGNSGDLRAIGTAIPEHHRGSLLAESLRQSADEAAE